MRQASGLSSQPSKRPFLWVETNGHQWWLLSCILSETPLIAPFFPVCVTADPKARCPPSRCTTRWTYLRVSATASPSAGGSGTTWKSCGSRLSTSLTLKVSPGPRRDGMIWQEKNSVPCLVVAILTLGLLESWGTGTPEMSSIGPFAATTSHGSQGPSSKLPGSSPSGPHGTLLCRHRPSSSAIAIPGNPAL